MTTPGDTAAAAVEAAAALPSILSLIRAPSPETEALAKTMCAGLRLAKPRDIHDIFYDQGRLEEPTAYQTQQLYAHGANGTWEHLPPVIAAQLLEAGLAGTFDSAYIAGAGPSLPWAFGAVSKALGVPARRCTFGLDELNAHLYAQTSPHAALRDAWRPLKEFYAWGSIHSTKSLREKMDGYLERAAGGEEDKGTLFILLDVERNLQRMRGMAKAWARHMVGPRDAVVLVQEEALGCEGAYQATAFLDSGGFVLEKIEQHVGVGTRAYTVALLRPRSKGENCNWRLLPSTTREALEAAIEEAREAEWQPRIGLVYRMGAYGAEPLPRPPGSSRPPLQPAPALSAEELARLHYRSKDPHTQAWKWFGWEYPGQTSALSATTGVCMATGLPDPDVLLQARGAKHFKPAFTGKGMHHSAKAGLKLQDMVTLGLLNPKAPWAGWEPIELRGAQDHALGYFYGGVQGRMEAIGIVVKEAGGSLFAFFMRLTDMEQRAISAAKAKGTLLNTLDVASMGLDSREARAAGMQGAVEGGLRSAKAAAIPAGAREAWRPELQALALAWQDSLEGEWGCTADDDAEQVGAEGEDKEDRALRLMIIYLRECCLSQADVEEEELRVMLAQQTNYAGMRAHRAAAQRLGLSKGGHMSVALAGKKKHLPLLTADDKEGAHAARSKGQAKQRVVLEQRVADDPTKYTSAFHLKQSTAATSGGAKNNKGEGHKGVSHSFMIATPPTLPRPSSTRRP